MGWFGPSRDEVWRELARQLDAEFVEGTFWRGGGKVQSRVGPWTITLDTYTVSTGKSSVTFTRMRVPYANPDGFRFKIYRAGFFSEFAKLLGMEDIEVGDPEFDEAFILKGNDEYRVRELFGDAALRDRFRAQEKIRITVKDDEGWFGAQFPEGVDELSFEVVGVIKDVEVLKGLFAIFADLLDRLVLIGSATRRPPEVEL